MPEIKIQHVVSCSSEDKNNPADNLLKPEGTHKWKCATAGEKNATVVFQFEKASQIQSIDIGNEGSAFVEVLVGKSAGSSDQDYQVLLVASTFMTPLEARNGTNRTSVRMFGPDKLSGTAIKEKWDRAKVVCTQPFNKTSAFGLSFIKFHSTPSSTGKEQTKTEEKKLGFFKLKNDENGSVTTGSLFAHRDKAADTKPPATGAAAIRAASRLAEESKPKAAPSMQSTPKPPPPPSSSSSSSEAATSKPIHEDKVKQKKVADMKSESSAKASPKQNREKRKHHVSEDDDTEEEEELSKPPLKKQTTSLSSTTSSRADKPTPIKKTKSEPPKESPVKELGKLMDRVVFVLSGYQNPHRGEIRDRALAMGATYKPDWGKGCTHLICAFANTPKYNQVSGKGKIVNQKWISDCYKQGKLLPWRKYRMGDADSPDEDSEEEEMAPIKASTSKPRKEEKPRKKEKSPSPIPVDVSDDDYGGDTDSGEDTEDEIRRVKEGKTKKKSPGKKVTPTKPKDPEDDPYGADTDEDEAGPSKMEEEDDGNDSGLPELPDFFSDKVFFFYGEMSASNRRLLTRYITAYNGEMEEYMSDNVKYVVTSAKWDDNFDDALANNPDLIFVKPKWVFMCHEKTKFLPHQPYIVVPDS